MMTRTERIFGNCVAFLAFAARKLGMSYEQINVLVFCVLWPLLTLGETLTIAVLWYRLWRITHAQ